MFLSAYESSAFESGLVGQSGASIWKIFGPGELVTVRGEVSFGEPGEETGSLVGVFLKTGEQLGEYGTFACTGGASCFPGNEELLFLKGVDGI